MGLLAMALLGLMIPVSGQVRTQKRITTAEEFISPAYGVSASHALGGITDQGDIYGYTGYDSEAPDPMALAWRWTFDGGMAYTALSPSYGTPLSAHNQTPYPYGNATQHGLGFYSAEPGGRVLAFSSDNRTETAGVTFNGMDPITTSRSTLWNGGPTGWFPFVNNPQAVSDGMEFDLEAYYYHGIYPGGNILGTSHRRPARVIDYSVSPQYWSWQAIGGLQLVDFLQSSAGSARQYYRGPEGYPTDRLIQAGINHGKTVGLAQRLLPDMSGNVEWKGVFWTAPETPVPIEEVIGIQAYPQHITEAGEIAGVLPSFTGNIQGEPFLRDGRVFLWLPKAKWGLPAGLNWLTAAGSQAQFIGMNDRGLVFYQLTTPGGLVEYYQWSSGSLRKWGFSSTTWSSLAPLGWINSKGWVVCHGTRIDNGKVDYVLSYPVVEVDLTVEPKEVEVGDEFELVAQVVSRSQYDVLGFGQSAVPQVAGDPNATVNGTPSPPPTLRTLPAGGNLTYRWRCRATRAGEARFSVELKGTPSNDPANVYRTLTMTSDAVTIKKPELVVNLAGDEPDADTTDECADVDLEKAGRQTTVRAALQYAATIPAADRLIKFDIPAGSSRAVRPASPLPSLPDDCEIDGLNQAGGITWLDGVLLPDPATILNVGANSKVRHLAFSGRSLRNHTGLHIAGENNEVTGCRFSQNEEGERMTLNTGIRIEASRQRIGGLAATEGNEFLDGEAGILVERPGAAMSQEIIIEGNRFGRSSITARTGPNNAVFFFNVAHSRIGGLGSGARNHFIGCRNAAVLILGPASTGNDIQGNWFGLKEDGSLAELSAFNGYGIAISLGAHHNRIGGAGESARNIISGSQEHGILFTRGVHHNIISGNWIGLDSAGTGAGSANNGQGIVILSGYNNRIGGSGDGERNVISDNRITGIQLGRDVKQVFKDPLMDPVNDACLDTIIEGNWIGTDHSGAQPVPNGRSWNGGGSGIEILSFTSGTTIGGAVTSKRNVISGNAGTALTVAGDAGSTTFVLGNRIGTTVDGLAGLPNQGAGIVMQGGSSLTVGGVIAGHGNQIAFNKGPGISLTRMKPPAPGVSLAGNLIHDNDRAGSIALAPRHPANDPGDGDTGPNGLQNWPMPVGAINQNGVTLVAFDLKSFARGTVVRVDAFTESGGGGKTLIGTQTVTTGSDPSDRYVITGTLQFVGGTITLMATTPDGSSEFSPPVKAVAGQDSDGDGLPDAMERQVPVTSGSGVNSPPAGDRNGDGTADELQANVASVQVPGEGAWITIAASGGLAITDVTGLRAVDVPGLPAGYLLEPGAVRFIMSGNTSSGSLLSLVMPALPPGTKVWIHEGASWSSLSHAEPAPEGSLSRLTFALPPRPSGSPWLLAIGRPAPPLFPPVLTLSPVQILPVGRDRLSAPLGLDGAGPTTTTSSLGPVQPISISRPAGAEQWTLQMSQDLTVWENIPSPDPGSANLFFAYPLQSGPRFFRWITP